MPDTLASLGTIALTSIFLAIYAALTTSYILYSIDWAPWNRLKALVGNRFLFMALCFCIVLLLTGFLIRIFLFSMLYGLAGYCLVATSTLIYLQLSHWKAPFMARARERFGAAWYFLAVVLSASIGVIVMYTILFLLLSR